MVGAGVKRLRVEELVHLVRQRCPLERAAGERDQRGRSNGMAPGWPNGRALPKRCWRRASTVCEGNAGRLLFCLDFSRTRFWKLSVVQRGGMVGALLL